MNDRAAADPKKQLRRVMGFWDVLLFNIAAVVGPRWIATAARTGTSSIGLWVLAAAFFFLPTALIVAELSTRFPEEGGLYVWSKHAFGEFHGFVAGWTYWVYTFFYFPGLLMASTAMAAYIGGSSAGFLAQERWFLLAGSFVFLGAAVWLNIVGLDIGKWLQNAGGIGTFVPLAMLGGLAAYLWHAHGSQTHFTWANMLPVWNRDTVNFWPQLAFAFNGLELCAAMSEEVREPRKIFARAIFGSGALIALMYIGGTLALLVLLPAATVDPMSGIFQAMAYGSALVGIGFFGALAALMAVPGNAGGIGSTVAGIARVPFVAGIDHYLPPAFGKIHPKWKTPWVAILVQAVISGAILLLTQSWETVKSAYLILVDAGVILYFIPFLYMYAAFIKLAYRADRASSENAALVPCGKFGVWVAGSLGFFVVLAGIILALIPPGDAPHKWLFEVKLGGGTAGAVLTGLALYRRGRKRQ